MPLQARFPLFLYLTILVHLILNMTCLNLTYQSNCNADDFFSCAVKSILWTTVEEMYVLLAMLNMHKNVKHYLF